MRIKGTVTALAVLGGLLAGCAGHGARLRLEPTSYVYEGYFLGSEDGVSAVVEDLRYAPELKGSVVVDLAFVNRRRAPIEVDLGLTEVRVQNREILAWEARAITVEPDALERATLSFRTDLGPDELKRGVLRIPGIKLDTGKTIEFQASFYVTTEEEEAAEAAAREER